jgi:hypothetical protein
VGFGAGILHLSIQARAGVCGVSRWLAGRYIESRKVPHPVPQVVSTMAFHVVPWGVSTGLPEASSLPVQQSLRRALTGMAPDIPPAAPESSVCCGLWASTGGPVRRGATRGVQGCA